MQDEKTLELIKPIVIEGGNDIPFVRLDKEKSIFEFKGKSLPEDVSEFYTPIIDWFTYYAFDPNDRTEIDFKLEYVNSGSSKMIFSILLKIQELQLKGKEVLVRWYFLNDDDDLRDEGRGFMEKLEIPFELIDYSE